MHPPFLPKKKTPSKIVINKNKKKDYKHKFAYFPLTQPPSKNADLYTY